VAEESHLEDDDFIERHFGATKKTITTPPSSRSSPSACHQLQSKSILIGDYFGVEDYPILTAGLEDENNTNAISQGKPRSKSWPVTAAESQCRPNCDDYGDFFGIINME
jgi:hypothetical protein